MGHPSVSGFKDVINTWKADKWDPERLVTLCKRVGAQYFFAMGNHHDNFDNWDSKYQPWNSVAIGPKKDLIAGWAKAAKDNGLPFGAGSMRRTPGPDMRLRRGLTRQASTPASLTMGS
jgi:alpha-L-fucosidase